MDRESTKEGRDHDEKNSHSFIQQAKNASLKLAERTQKYLSSEKKDQSLSPPVSPRDEKSLSREKKQHAKTRSASSDNGQIENRKKQGSEKELGTSELKALDPKKSNIEFQAQKGLQKKQTWESATRSHSLNLKKPSLEVKKVSPDFPRHTQGTFDSPKASMTRSNSLTIAQPLRKNPIENHNFQNVCFQNKTKLANPEEPNSLLEKGLSGLSDFELNTYYFHKRNSKDLDPMTKDNIGSEQKAENSDLKEIIEINCGGKLFMTFKSTLLFKPESMLGISFYFWFLDLNI